jgi:hypothetical protein
LWVTELAVAESLLEEHPILVDGRDSLLALRRQAMPELSRPVQLALVLRRNALRRAGHGAQSQRPELLGLIRADAPDLYRAFVQARQLPVMRCTRPSVRSVSDSGPIRGAVGRKCGRFAGTSEAAEGIRTLDLLHGKQSAGLGATRNIPANRPLLPRERVPPMPGIYREITGVPGLKPDWR